MRYDATEGRGIIRKIPFRDSQKMKWLVVILMLFNYESKIEILA